MLHTQTVEPRTFSVLKRLMAMPALSQFYLVGRTALSLKYGHRKSIDLDLFSSEKFSNEKIINALQDNFGQLFVYQGGNTKWGVFGFIEDIKIDIVYYPHPIIGKAETIDGVRFYSDADLMAMKVQAILGRGVKKYFWDIAQLLQHYSLQEMMDAHAKKYPNQMLAISIPQALSYFSDADESEPPIALNHWKWHDVKHIISEEIRKYLNY